MVGEGAGAARGRRRQRPRARPRRADARRRTEGLARPPSTAPLVFEVSDATLLFDREEKLPLYARARVPEYVIANVRKRELEVYSRPVPTEARYGRRDLLGVREVFRSRATPVVLKVRDVFADCP